MSEFQKWWDEKYGQILTITNDLDADASCRVAKIAAMDAWMAGRAALEAERDALRADAERYQWLRHADLDALAAANWGEGDVYEGEEFDRAIDAAIAAKEPNRD